MSFTMADRFFIIVIKSLRNGDDESDGEDELLKALGIR